MHFFARASNTETKKSFGKFLRTHVRHENEYKNVDEESAYEFKLHTLTKSVEF